MVSGEFTKRERQQLRELAGDAYEAELNRALEQLAGSFDRWREGKLIGSELSQAIHEFHQGEARQLWSMYQTLKDPDVVARAIALDLIRRESVPQALQEKLASLVDLIRRR